MDIFICGNHINMFLRQSSDTTFQKPVNGVHRENTPEQTVNKSYNEVTLTVCYPAQEVEGVVLPYQTLSYVTDTRREVTSLKESQVLCEAFLWESRRERTLTQQDGPWCGCEPALPRRRLPEVSTVPLRFMESRERCFLVQDPMVLGVGVWGGGRGWARLSSQESRRLARPLHSDSLPEYTQIREEATGKKAEEKRPKELSKSKPKMLLM
ncbi:hypothetical protein INR49_028576 [Caranx melampygus]|nr:hypothetical protein INR49_028576 [Caranx melampygus]